MDFRLSDGMDSETYAAVTVAGSGSANIKGAWTQLIASTSREASGIEVTAAAGYGTLLDIGIGAVGSEYVIIPNLFFESVTQTYSFPIAIPAGARIVARLQNAYGSQSSSVHVRMTNEGFASSSGFSRVTAYGISTATSVATTVMSGANTWGSWYTLGTTSNPCSAIVLSLTPNATTNAAFAVQVGLGPGPTTAVDGLISVPVSSGRSGSYGMDTWTLPLSIPVGTTVSARVLGTYSGSLTTYCAVYGID